MHVMQRDMPLECSFIRGIEKFYRWDSFEVPLRRTELSIQDIYLGIFSHPPRIFKILLVIRNAIVSMFGIKGPSTAQVNHIAIKEKYAVGEKIALFTLFSQSESEIIAGGDDKHLDFKVSVLKINESGTERVVLTTVVSVHNLFGKVYLFFIMPFHRTGVKMIMSNAVANNRL